METPDRTKLPRLEEIEPGARSSIIDALINVASEMVRSNEVPATHTNFHPTGDESDCPICSAYKDFELPNELISDIVNGKSVLFAGAGISEPMPRAYNVRFYDVVLDYLGIEKEANIAFSTLMSRLCEEPNGRIKLLELVKKHFNTVDDYDEMQIFATRFHELLGPIFEIDTIVTTNWDCYFEDHANAIPFVTAKDFAFWNYPGRKVVKLHGSLSNISSIVATEDDYSKCQERLENGVLGGHLKTLFTTKTIIYVGFSASDSDFLNIHESVRREMPELTRQAYIVTLSEDDDDRLRNLGMIPIHTDAWHFLNTVRVEVEKTDHHLPESELGKITLIRKLREDCHNWLFESFDFKEHPQIIFAAFYQDGLQHGVQRILNRRKSGASTHLCETARIVHSYEQHRKAKVKGRLYGDVAYIDGFMAAYRFLFTLSDSSNTVLPPLFYIYGSKNHPRNCQEYRDQLGDAPRKHKTAHEYAKKCAENFKDRGSVTPHHPPVL